MTNNEVREAIARIWGQFMREERYFEAVMISSLMYSLGREKENKAVAMEAVGMLEAAIKELSPGTGEVLDEQKCSFCGQSPPKVKLGAGPNAFICSDCVRIFSDKFNS